MDRYEIRRLNLIKLRDTRCGKKITNLAKIIDRDPSYVSRMLYEEGRTAKKRISEKLVEVIESSFELPRGALDNPEFDASKPLPLPSSLEAPDLIRNSKFPVITAIQAGTWTTTSNDLTGVTQFLSTTEKAGSSSFWLKVIGDSMTTPSGLSFPDGMYILVDPEVPESNKSFVIAKLTDVEEATLRQFFIDAGSKFLKPLNPDPIYKSIPIDDKNCRIVGVVVDAKWKLK